MQEDHQKILSCKVLKQCVRYPIIKEIKYFELLRCGSYKSFMNQSRQTDMQL